MKEPAERLYLIIDCPLSSPNSNGSKAAAASAYIHNVQHYSAMLYQTPLYTLLNQSLNMPLLLMVI